jgi:hypothetical protein
VTRGRYGRAMSTNEQHPTNDPTGSDTCAHCEARPAVATVGACDTSPEHRRCRECLASASEFAEITMDPAGSDTTTMEGALRRAISARNRRDALKPGDYPEYLAALRNVREADEAVAAARQARRDERPQDVRHAEAVCDAYNANQRVAMDEDVAMSTVERPGFPGEDRDDHETWCAAMASRANAVRDARAACGLPAFPAAADLSRCAYVWGTLRDLERPGIPYRGLVSLWTGILAEYLPGGDQLAEVCDCHPVAQFGDPAHDEIAEERHLAAREQRDPHGYLAACDRAAEEQGLAAFTDDDAWEVQQTGGFTMVATRPVMDGLIWTVTHDGHGYLAGLQTSEAWEGGEEDPGAIYLSGLSEDDALALDDATATAHLAQRNAERRARYAERLRDVERFTEAMGAFQAAASDLLLAWESDHVPGDVLGDTYGLRDSFEDAQAAIAGWEIQRPAAVVGQRVAAAYPLDRACVVVPEGATGTVVAVEPGMVRVKMDAHVPGLEEWDNEVWCATPDDDESDEPSAVRAFRAMFVEVVA